MSLGLRSCEEALALVRARALELCADRPPAERADLAAASGRVLAAPLLADRDLPPFARSTRDGFACRAREAASHAWLPVAGSIRAGQPPAAPLPAGAAWEIMTGAPVPDDADAVVMLEHVESSGNSIRLLDSRTLERGENTIPRGAEAREGDEIIPAGVRLRAPQLALAAACGYATVPVFARPRVAVLTTGDELVAVASTPGPGQIRNSNAPMLASLVASAGGRPLILPTAADEPEALSAAIEQAARADLFLVSGGVSAGKFDLVEEALARAGAEFHFTGVRIQPGKPTVFGRLPRGSGPGARIQPFFGLPGNPISTAATFHLFVAPMLAALSGASEPAPRFALARLSKDCKGKPNLARFVPAHCAFDGPFGETPSVATVAWQGSGDLAAFARTNCLLVVPEGVEVLRAGEFVRILLP
jgi:molybdopterin molybdotransferase